MPSWWCPVGVDVKSKTDDADLGREAASAVIQPDAKISEVPVVVPLPPWLCTKWTPKNTRQENIKKEKKGETDERRESKEENGINLLAVGIQCAFLVGAIRYRSCANQNIVSTSAVVA